MKWPALTNPMTLEGLFMAIPVVSSNRL